MSSLEISHTFSCLWHTDFHLLLTPSRQLSSLTTLRRPCWSTNLNLPATEAHSSLQILLQILCNNRAMDFSRPTYCMNNEWKSFRLFFAHQLCCVERYTWGFHSRSQAWTPTKIYITYGAVASVIDCCQCSPQLTERWERGVGWGCWMMWVRPAGDHGDNKVDVKSRFIFCNLKNPSRPHEKVIMSGKKF